MGTLERATLNRRPTWAIALIVSALAPSISAEAQAKSGLIDALRELPVGCAGDGQPTRPWQLTGLMSLQGVPYAGADASLRMGDAATGTGFGFRTVRFGLCGVVKIPVGELFYDAVYEPIDLTERAQPDAKSWGRIAAAEAGFRPWRWLAVSLGVRKLMFDYGHDEPEQALVLPVRPAISSSVAPDRRAGLTIDNDFGEAHLVYGLYEGSRDLVPTSSGGLMLVARLVAEPQGPVGRSLSTIDDSPFWRRRFRWDFNLSILYEYIAGMSGYALGTDVGGKWGPVGLVAAYLNAQTTFEEWPTQRPTPRTSRQGAWVETAVMVLRPYLEIAGRYDWMDSPHEPRDKFNALTMGLNGYPIGRVLRAQLLYTHKFHFGPTYRDDSLLLVATVAR